MRLLHQGLAEAARVAPTSGRAEWRDGDFQKSLIVRLPVNEAEVS